MKTEVSNERSRRLSLTSLSLPIVLVLLMIIFSILSPYFFTIKNLMNIGMYSSINGIIAVGMTFVILTANIDISVGSILALSGMAGPYILSIGLPSGIALLSTLVIGMLLGSINGFVVTRLKVNSLIATLGTMAIFRGVSLIISKARVIYTPPGTFFDFIGTGRIFEIIPFAFVIMITAYLIGYLVLRKTPFGWNIYSVGGNPNACELLGIGVDKVIFFAFVLSGFSSALGSSVFMSMLGSWVPKVGLTTALDVITATILGGISVFGGRGKIGGVILGVLIIAVIGNGLTILNVISYWQDVAKGSLLIFAIYINQIEFSRK